MIKKTRFDFQGNKISVAAESFLKPRLCKTRLFRKKGIWTIRVEIIGAKKEKQT